MTGTDAGAEFWTFTLSFYGRPGVSPACIALQDAHGKDVNLALYCCWCGLSGRGALSAADIAAAEGAITPWRKQVIEPLRAARRALKGADGAAALYDSVKQAELDGERLGQARLAALAPAPQAAGSPAGNREAAAANLALYCSDSGARDAAAPLFAAITAG